MDRITKDLVNIAMEHGFGVELTPDMKPYTTALTSIKYHKIIVNTNYYVKDQIIFQFAHELGHVLNGDESLTPLYYSPTKYKIEGAANRTAIGLLIPYYFKDTPLECVNIVNFMNAFKIPSHLTDIATIEINEYYSK